MKDGSVAGSESQEPWQLLHRRIFTGTPVEDGAFADPAWKVVLLPGELLLDRQDFDSLAASAAEVGDAQFIVMDGEGDFRDEPPVVLSWDFESFARFCPSSVFCQAVAHSFGQSGQWGRVSSYDGFNALGGSPGFMDGFVERSGGVPVLYERFLEAVRNGEIGWGEQGREYARQLVRRVGWEDFGGCLDW